MFLGAICTAVLGVRLPAMYSQPGGQDEDFYAVPGWTILQTGIPRIPYLPSRDPSSVFYHADHALFALPPLYFYWQALVYAVTGPSYASGRLASLIAGLAAIVLTYVLAILLTGRRSVGFLAAWGYSWSRLFFFPACSARPDMLCATLGLACIVTTVRWMQTQRMRWIVLSGLFAGLAALTHPFAIVVATQLLLLIMIAKGPSFLQKLKCLAAASAAIGLTFSTWLILIVAYPQEFRYQFFNNVLNRSGPGLLDRLANPLPSLTSQCQLIQEHFTTLQAALLFAGLAWGIVHWIRTAWQRQLAAENSARLPTPMFLACSACLLLIVCQGQHPAKGYWCYPGAFLFVCVAQLFTAAFGHQVKGVIVAHALLLIALLPGSGIRATWVFLNHWTDLDYRHQLFVDRVLQQCPADLRYLVDATYVFDFYLAGRYVTLAQNDPLYFRADQMAYDRLIVSRCGIAECIPEQLGSTFVEQLGNPQNEWTHFIRIYRPPN